MVVEIVADRIELVDAGALLLPVDGQLCRLGGAAAAGIRIALDPDERVDELEYLEDQLARIRPLPHPRAHALDGVARWQTIVVSAAYPHDVDGRTFAPAECGQMLRAALPVAIELVEQLALGSLAATLIGTAYRMPVDLAIRAFVDGVAAAAARDVRLRWSLPDPAHREQARVACERLGLAIG